MIRNIDIGLLRTFVATADKGSVTAAAASLNLTQSAVSQQLGRLETLLQAHLLTRDHLGSRTTPAGERLLESARRMLSMNDDLWADMTGNAVGGRIRLGAPEDLIGSILHPILKRFSGAYPSVEISVLAAPSPEIASALDQGLVDLILVEQLDPLPAYEHLSEEKLVWIGAPGGDAWRRTPLPVSLTAPGCAFRAVVKATLEHADRSSMAVLDGQGTETTLAAIRADLAVGVWLKSMVPDGLEVISGAGLPSLPAFAVQLGLPSRFPPSPAAMALAQEIRDELSPAKHGLVEQAARFRGGASEDVRLLSKRSAEKR